MAEYTPTTETVRECFVDGAEGDFIGEDFDRWLAEVRREAAEKAVVEVGVCYHQNAQYLAMMSERDALRAEVERLRGVERGWQHDRAEWERERDEARQQLADLRAGIEALADAKPGATGRALRALLAGSGEQPGERARCSGCGPGYRVGDEGCRHRPAPVPSDSADALRDRVAEALWNFDRPVTQGWAEAVRVAERNVGGYTAADVWAYRSRADAVLAVVGQDVTVDDVPEQIARYVEATATDLSPSGYRAGIATAVRLIRRWRPEYAAVRPSEKGQVDD